MNADSDLSAALTQAADDLAGTLLARPADEVLRQARGRQLRRRVLVGTCGLALAATAAVPLSQYSRPRDQVVQPAAGSAGRTIEIGPRTAALLQQSFPRASAPYSQHALGAVLASTDGAAGEMVLLGVRLPDGKRCVVQRYAEDVPGAGDGVRCAGAGSTPFAGRSVDVSAGEDPAAPTSDSVVVWGALPAGTSTVQLRGDDGRVTTVSASAGGDQWDGRAFFITLWPTNLAGTAVAVGGNGRELGNSRLPF